MKRITFALAACFALSSCHAEKMKDNPGDSGAVRFVALGDSYTIGEGATWETSWPYLLAKSMNEKGKKVKLVANPSRTGWTTQDLIDNELPVFDTCRADVVTLLIGVNDWVQGVSADDFKKNLVYILDHVQAKLEDKTKILLVTIPDFGVTPTGKFYSGGRDISAGITQFNDIIRDEAKKRNLPLVDIFPVSKDMGKDSSLVAKDGLHPSAKEYAIWETLILPEFEEMINDK
ncbi:MAG TPA: SGNH/GDSL hydrolase family protein [Bacteroidia bacterium]|nr:SGNH/GDSL hydrolase family protein [Bacteroidia bacterium]